MSDVKWESFDIILFILFGLGCIERVARAVLHARHSGRRSGRPLSQVVRIPVAIDQSSTFSHAEPVGGHEAIDDS